jgi:hypothetical protein
VTEVFVDPIVREWECRRRGDCCRSWRVDATLPELRTMASRVTARGDLTLALQVLAGHVDEARLDGAGALPMTANGACMFLRNNLCSYRTTYGEDTLPRSCRRFPHLAMLTPRRALYGLSFACPTALALLCARPTLMLVAGGEAPPTEPYDFRGGDDEEENPDAVAFWETHWSWLATLRALEGAPAERLRALVEGVSGVTLPVVEGGPEGWAASEGALADTLAEAGVVSSVVAELVADHSPRSDPGPLEVSDEDTLLGAYLEHRMMVPEFLMTGASLGRLIGALFAIVARFRFERARGVSAAAALAHVERLLLHSDLLDRMFGAHPSEPEVWQSLGVLALARSSAG